jgi:predicted NBD/HSP70 family sugar kinase
VQFLQLYWGAAATGALTQCWWDKYRPSLGASGAVNAVVIMSAMLSPNRIFLIYGVLPLAAYQAAGLYLAYDIYGAYQVRKSAPLDALQSMFAPSTMRSSNTTCLRRNSFRRDVQLRFRATLGEAFGWPE